MLTAADVEQKTFSTALRGYDLDEVDDFLDEIVATIRDLTEQIEAAQADASGKPFAVAVPAPAPEPTPAAEPERLVEPPRPEIDESAIGRALVAAQTAADQLLADARQEADLLVEDAKSEVNTWVAEKEARRSEAEAEISALAARVASVRSELSVLAGEVSEKLDDMDSVIEGTYAAGSKEGLETESSEEDEPAYEVTAAEAPVDEPEATISAQGEEPEDEEETDGVVEDNLDAMLNGVATDLQLNGNGESDDGGSDEEPEELSDEDEDSEETKDENE